MINYFDKGLKVFYIINNKNKTNHPISSNSHPSTTANIAINNLIRGGIQNQREHHIIYTKYEAVHPTYVTENNSSSGMLILLAKNP